MCDGCLHCTVCCWFSVGRGVRCWELYSSKPPYPSSPPNKISCSGCGQVVVGGPVFASGGGGGGGGAVAAAEAPAAAKEEAKKVEEEEEEDEDMGFSLFD